MIPFLQRFSHMQTGKLVYNNKYTHFPGPGDCPPDGPVLLFIYIYTIGYYRARARAGGTCLVAVLHAASVIGCWGRAAGAASIIVCW